ncbi:MAG: hypothetical protein JOZ57_03375 [Abitibacteriaceae bacterium]|nr:hypothetical protein [Abditibacteriaceae bacterium]
MQIFTLRAAHALFFTPSSFNLDFLVDYTIDGQPNQDVIDHQFSVRAPLWAIITGSIIGSILGYIMKTIFSPPAPASSGFGDGTYGAAAYLLRLLAYVILATIIVVAFARKKDVQPILSIEDFYGGFFVGVLAAYTGPDLLAQFLHVGSNAAPATAANAISNAASNAMTAATNSASAAHTVVNSAVHSTATPIATLLPAGH